MSHMPTTEQPNGGASSAYVYNVMDYGATGDGVTDDSVAIRATIAAAFAAGGAIVYFPNGTYIVSREVGPLFGGCVAISEGISLLGQSKLGAIIKLAPDQPTFTRMLTVDSADDVTISNLTIDGNKTNQANPEEHMGGVFAGSFGGEQFRLTVRDCVIHDCCGDGITIYGTARDTLIESVYIYDCDRDGIAITGAGAARTTIRDCQIVDCAAQAIDGEPQDGITYDLTVDSCYLRRSVSTPDYAFATSGPFVGRDDGLVFTNNVVEGACCIRARANTRFCGNKVTTTTDDGSRRPLEIDGETYDVVIDGNVFEAVDTASGAAVRITGRSLGYPEAPYHTVFSNNIIRSNGAEGLQLLGAHSVKVIGNEIRGNGSNAHTGIEVRALMSMSRVELIGNHVQDYAIGVQAWGADPAVLIDEFVMIGNVAEAIDHASMTAWSLNDDSRDLIQQCVLIGNEARNTSSVFAATVGWPAVPVLIGGNRGDGGMYFGAPDNLWIGSAPASISTVFASTALGYGALAANETAGHAVAVGWNAFANLNGNTLADSVAVGARAGTYATTAGDLTLVGYRAGENTTTGDSNTAIGSECFVANTTGEENTVVGVGALGASTTANSSVAIGVFALSAVTVGHQNIGVGHRAGAGITTGQNNVAIGFEAMRGAVTTGDNNIAIGQRALDALKTGQSNVAVGGGALPLTTTGNVNTAVGTDAMQSNTSGYSNVAVGNAALNSNTSGAANVAVGMNALDDQTTGNFNTAIGYNTALGITTGSYNTIIGAQVGGLSAALSNTVIIADGAGTIRVYVDSSGNICKGSAAGPLWASGNGTPEGTVTAPVGSFYSRLDGGANTTWYVKESGTGNTGWVAK